MRIHATALGTPHHVAGPHLHMDVTELQGCGSTTAAHASTLHAALYWPHGALYLTVHQQSAHFSLICVLVA